MQKFKEFEPADRYIYDFGICSYKNGFSQIDTSQDAWYFGTWANPYKLIIFNYCEGDCYTTICETEEEFKQEIIKLKDWNLSAGYSCNIDPGLDPKNIEQWEKIVGKEMLH